MAVSIELEQNDQIWTLRIAGELDYSECAALRMQIDRVLQAMPPGAIVDMSGIEYLDSSGLGLLLSLSREYGAHGGRLVLVANATIDGILELTRLTGIFSIAHDGDEARALLADIPLPAR